MHDYQSPIFCHINIPNHFSDNRQFVVVPATIYLGRAHTHNLNLSLYKFSLRIADCSIKRFRLCGNLFCDSNSILYTFYIYGMVYKSFHMINSTLLKTQNCNFPAHTRKTYNATKYFLLCTSWNVWSLICRCSLCGLAVLVASYV